MTDANLVLGRLVETEFLGGALQLDVDRARRALAPLARRLGRSIPATAAGIVAVATAAMERAVRVITIERGHDPRDFTLVAFGGAGALHAAELAAGLGIARVYVPRHPGLLSAWGVLTAAVVRDASATLRAVAPSATALRRALAPLDRAVRAELRREGARAAAVERTLDARYTGQSYEVRVPFGPRWEAAFHREHQRRFGHAAPGRAIEVVTVRVRGRGAGARVPLDPPPRGGGRRPIAVRAVHLGGRTRPTPVFRRDDLPVGRRVIGPAIVCEYSATTVVPPGWRLRVDRVGGLVLECGRA